MLNLIVLFLVIGSHLLASQFFLRKLELKEKHHLITLLVSCLIVSSSTLSLIGILTRVSLIIVSTSFIFLFWQERKNLINTIRSFAKNTSNLIIPGLVIFITGLINILVPLKEIDSIAYHLPITNQIVKTGSIWEVFDPGFISPNTYFPANHELLQATLRLLTNTDNFNFLITATGLIILYLSIQSFSNKKTLNFAIWLSVISVPFLLEQVNNLQVDLFLTAILATAIISLINVTRSPEAKRSELILVMLLLGIAIGTKYNSVLQLVTLIPFFVYVIWNKRHSLKQLWWTPLVMLLTGGIWYLRNWLVASNPIYPFEVNSLGLVGHRQFLDDMFNSSLNFSFQNYGLVQTVKSITNNSQFFTLGTPVIILLGIFTLSLAILHLAKIKKQRLLYLSLITALILQILAYLNAPYTFFLWSETIRYTSGIFACLIGILTLLISNFKSKTLSKITTVFLILVSCVNLIILNPFFHSETLEVAKSNLGFNSISAIIILLGVITTTLTNQKIPKFSHKLRNSILVALSVLFLFSIQTSEFNPVSKLKYWEQKLMGFERLQPVYHELLNIVKPEDRSNTKIALSGLNHYSLFQELGFETTYIHIDGCQTCHYPDYKEEPRSVRSNPNEDGWITAMIDQNIDFFIVGITNHHNENVELREETWAKKHPEIFSSVYNANNISIYELKR